MTVASSDLTASALRQCSINRATFTLTA